MEVAGRMFYQVVTPFFSSIDHRFLRLPRYIFGHIMYIFANMLVVMLPRASHTVIFCQREPQSSRIANLLSPEREL